MKIGIVGSRRRNSLYDQRIVQDIIRKFHEKFGQDLTIVSGHCRKGADRFAEDYADLLEIEKLIFPVPLDPPIKNKWDFRERAFARNRLIAEGSDVLFALVSSDRTGGTESTVTHAKELNRICYLVDEEGGLSLA